MLATVVAAVAASASTTGPTGSSGASGQSGQSPPAGLPPACSDLKDNDGDGLIDLADPGCSGPQDTDESDATDRRPGGADRRHGSPRPAHGATRADRSRRAPPAHGVHRLRRSRWPGRRRRHHG